MCVCGGYDRGAGEGERGLSGEREHISILGLRVEVVVSEKAQLRAGTFRKCLFRAPRALFLPPSLSDLT